MKLIDIIPLEDWVAIERKIVAKSGLDANVFDTNGRRISTFKHWANRLCPAIKDTDRGQSFICAVAHMNIATIAKNTGQAVIEECDAGLLKLVVPIFFKGEFVGAVGVCGALLDDGEVDEFMINKTTEIESKTIENLAADIPKTIRKNVESLRDFIVAEIDRIGCESVRHLEK